MTDHDVNRRRTPGSEPAAAPQTAGRRRTGRRRPPATGQAAPPRRRWALVAVAVTAVLGLAAVAGLVALAEHARAGAVVRADADDARVPSDSATDWVTYGDHVAVVQVSHEKRLPIPAGGEGRHAETNGKAAPVADRGDGEEYVGRSVTLTVRKVLWTRDAAPELPARVSFQADGWVVEDGKLTAAALPDTPRLEKGHTYVLALARFSDGWAPTGPGGILPYDDRTIGRGEIEGRTVAPGPDDEPGGNAPLKQKVNGRTADDLLAHLRAATPDPRAEDFAELPADERREKASHTTG